MNAVEIEEAVSKLAGEPFDPAAFPFAFLEAFGNKATTINRLKSGSSNASDIAGGVLQRNNIHIAVCDVGQVTQVLGRLKASPKTAAGKAKFILATDGQTLEAEDLASGETVACAYGDFANHFGFFLPLAGITTVKQIRNNPIDIQATGRLNRLYVELLRENEDWSKPERRHDLNQFMARLIFCFFAEDTGIFFGEQLFTKTIEQMSDGRSGNTHEVIGEIFRAMDTPIKDRKAAGFRLWADTFPYVNGGLFADTKDVPRFSRIARSYLLHAGSLDWKQINPDIFGSMIQAVADEEERGELGMHYTSVPNILKVLNPLFLDDLREQLEQAGDNMRKLLNLRRRIASIRVFDPACGSGNFLVIAYIHMREIEAEIIRRRREEKKKSWIRLANFYGIELKDFAAEIARLSLLIAEFQCDVRLIGQQEALIDVLPLKKTGQIHTGNALRLDWLKVCPPAIKMEHQPTDLFDTAPDQPEIDFNAQEVETFICSNPPYKGSQLQKEEQKADLDEAFASRLNSIGSADYVSGWLIKARDFLSVASGRSGFVTTNSLNQGRQVPLLWPLLLDGGFAILFAHLSFKWSNLATDKAGVTVTIIGYGKPQSPMRFLISEETRQSTTNISPYLVSGPNNIVEPRASPLSCLEPMSFGSMANDAGALLLEAQEVRAAIRDHAVPMDLIRTIAGSQEFINGVQRFCLWISNNDHARAVKIPWVSSRFDRVKEARQGSSRLSTRKLASVPHRFGEVRQRGDETVVIVPSVSSESRDYLPVGFLPRGSIITNLAFALYDAQLWNMALIASRIHLVWIATVCGKLETRYRYSNTLGWNTFPVPPLTEKNKTDLTRCAEDILLAREAHFPATIADLYEPDQMPDDLRHAHDRNDETLERIYIGRRFKNDTERLEKLFDLYTKMTAGQGKAAKPLKVKKGQKSDSAPDSLLT